MRLCGGYLQDRAGVSESARRAPDTQERLYRKPKPNGYRSLHLIAEVPVALSFVATVVPVEIQLRTISMNMWASLEHEVSYKAGAELKNRRLRNCVPVPTISFPWKSACRKSAAIYAP